MEWNGMTWYKAKWMRTKIIASGKQGWEPPKRFVAWYALRFGSTVSIKKGPMDAETSVK
jgi:hypothetical protein